MTGKNTDVSIQIEPKVIDTTKNTTTTTTTATVMDTTNTPTNQLTCETSTSTVTITVPTPFDRIPTYMNDAYNVHVNRDPNKYVIPILTATVVPPESKSKSKSPIPSPSSSPSFSLTANAGSMQKGGIRGTKRHIGTLIEQHNNNNNKNNHKEPIVISSSVSSDSGSDTSGDSSENEFGLHSSTKRIKKNLLSIRANEKITPLSLSNVSSSQTTEKITVNLINMNDKINSSITTNTNTKTNTNNVNIDNTIKTTSNHTPSSSTKNTAAQTEFTNFNHQSQSQSQSQSQNIMVSATSIPKQSTNFVGSSTPFPITNSLGMIRSFTPLPTPLSRPRPNPTSNSTQPILTTNVPSNTTTTIINTNTINNNNNSDNDNNDNNNNNSSGIDDRNNNTKSNDTTYKIPYTIFKNTNMLSTYFNSKTFSDCTVLIAWSEANKLGYSVPAHKLILSSCSAYFIALLGKCGSFFDNPSKYIYICMYVN